ncbi:hypothetical protein [Bradyrhizobium sp. SK17]|uniref:hypothetical protein n=1 Tax=Bradyrhizobium sp. SK17 TaxID=2057741 RepID=UPI0012FD7845|nr:hypothetical protein [Bradyrhizobium sp. SK17]
MFEKNAAIDKICCLVTMTVLAMLAGVNVGPERSRTSNLDDAVQREVERRNRAIFIAM